MSAPGRVLWVALGAASIAFHLGLIFSGLVPNLLSRPVHMLLALPWVFIFSAKTRTQMISGIALTLLGGAATLYVALNEASLVINTGF